MVPIYSLDSVSMLHFNSLTKSLFYDTIIKVIKVMLFGNKELGL